MPEEILQTLVYALALLLVVEGMGPFIAPEAWRRYLLAALQMSHKALRIMGFIMMCCGLLLLRLKF